MNKAKHMSGVHVVNQKIIPGAMELIWEVNFLPKYFKQMKVKLLPCVYVQAD